ncbi:UPF0481 protein At3g47200-like [Alnus glutinosa]|uniref:UPF0481 protein At3g47200-like n=1 Tax=Alnus glutinosa TaxID=3517 RepID=UPI002D7A36DE|nr:UPF0481 protein At3g47200-like [Alnus glutinosa]
MGEYQRATLVNNITSALESLEPLSSLPEPCIYKVPDPLRKLNKKAYSPQILSIGPFHHGDEKLQNMKKHKLRYLKEFMEWANKNFEELLLVIEESEEIVQQSWKCYDKILLKPWLAATMQRDLVLLENQLPFFIVKKLFDHTIFPSQGRLPSFTELTFNYFKSFNTQNLLPNPKPIIMHFVDLLRRFYLPKSLPKRTTKKVKHVYSATQLDGKGLKFMVDHSRHCLLNLDLDYKKGVLKIPHITLDDITKFYVRNLTAFEQCHYPNAAYVTDYFILLDFLIKSEKDVDLLGRKGIMVNGFGNNDATFIKNLATTSLRRDYFGNPWKAASTTAVVIMLILTLIQAICSIISIYPDH